VDGYEDLVGSDRMWVRLGEAWSGNPTLRWRIVGNGHTHRGRIAVEPIGTSDPPVNISLGDVVDCSAEAKIWLNGFLAGQEAGLNEFLGREVDQVSASEIERWQDWNASWRRTVTRRACSGSRRRSTYRRISDHPFPGSTLRVTTWCARTAHGGRLRRSPLHTTLSSLPRATGGRGRAASARPDGIMRCSLTAN
jgi:hypothetical protein